VYKNAYPENNNQFSILNAFVVAVAGATSSVAGGRLADKMETTYGPKFSLVVPIVGSVLGLGAILACLQMKHNFYGSIALLCLSYLLVECWFGPCLKVLQGRIPNEAKATGISGRLCCFINVFGWELLFFLGACGKIRHRLLLVAALAYVFDF
jgi:hypothetical protein